jgi:hypothetical protein
MGWDPDVPVYNVAMVLVAQGHSLLGRAARPDPVLRPRTPESARVEASRRARGHG